MKTNIGDFDEIGKLVANIREFAVELAETGREYEAGKVAAALRIIQRQADDLFRKVVVEMTGDVSLADEVGSEMSVADSREYLRSREVP